VFETRPQARTHCNTYKWPAAGGRFWAYEHIAYKADPPSPSPHAEHLHQLKHPFASLSIVTRSLYQKTRQIKRWQRISSPLLGSRGLTLQPRTFLNLHHKAPAQHGTKLSKRTAHRKRRVCIQVGSHHLAHRSIQGLCRGSGQMLASWRFMEQAVSRERRCIVGDFVVSTYNLTTKDPSAPHLPLLAIKNHHGDY